MFNYVKGIIEENVFNYIVFIDKISFNGFCISYLLICVLFLKFLIVEKVLSMVVRKRFRVL